MTDRFTQFAVGEVLRAASWNPKEPAMTTETKPILAPDDTPAEPADDPVPEPKPETDPEVEPKP